MTVPKRSAGQFLKFKASELNAIADAANKNLQHVLELNASMGTALKLCYFKHGVTAWSVGSPPSLSEWDVVAGDVVIYRQSVSPEEFRRRTIVTGRRPMIYNDAPASVKNDHYHPIVSLQPLAYGRIGLGVMAGLTPVKTRVVSLAHPCVAHDMEDAGGGRPGNRYLRFKTASHGFRIVASDIQQLTIGDTAYPVVDLSHPQGLSWYSENAASGTFLGGGLGDTSGAWVDLDPWATTIEDAGELFASGGTSGLYLQPGRYRVTYSAEFACSHTTYLGDVITVRMRSNSPNDPGVRQTVQLHPESAGSGVSYIPLHGWFSEEILDTSANVLTIQARVDFAVGSYTVGTLVEIADLRILVEKVA